jgi:SAM-dependent methyltransferase
MAAPATPTFAGSIPENYHRNLGPVLFEPYARDMAARVASLKLAPGARVLEMACGTGIVTAQLLKALPAGVALVSTDVSEPMLAVARKLLPADPRLTLSQADACALPFRDGEFDAVVCQYGVMFFPDKVKAMREARRVLKPGGVYLFSVWESLERNPLVATVQGELERRWPANPPAFLRTPYGWHDRAEIERVARAGGFSRVGFTALEFPSGAASAEKLASAFLEGTPLTADLVDRKADVGAVVASVAKTLAERHGAAPCKGMMAAVVVEAR